MFDFLDDNHQVFIEKCKYLKESKCLGICINTCKLPTQVCLCLAYGILDFYPPDIPLLLSPLVPSGIVYQKYRHNDMQSSYAFCMATVGFTEWSSKGLFPERKFLIEMHFLFSDFLQRSYGR